MERVKGIEPSLSAWEAAALPLSYTRLTVELVAKSVRVKRRLCGGYAVAKRVVEMIKLQRREIPWAAFPVGIVG